MILKENFKNSGEVWLLVRAFVIKEEVDHQGEFRSSRMALIIQNCSD